MLTLAAGVLMVAMAVTLLWLDRAGRRRRLEDKMDSVSCTRPTTPPAGESK